MRFAESTIREKDSPDRQKARGWDGRFATTECCSAAHRDAQRAGIGSLMIRLGYRTGGCSSRCTTRPPTSQPKKESAARAWQTAISEPMGVWVAYLSFA